MLGNVERQLRYKRARRKLALQQERQELAKLVAALRPAYIAAEIAFALALPLSDPRHVCGPECLCSNS